MILKHLKADMDVHICLPKLVVLFVLMVSFNISLSKPVFVTEMKVNNVKITNETYQKEREHLISVEKLKRLGGEIVLTTDEQKVNEILMKLKTKEIENSLNDGNPFAVADNFLVSKPKYEASAVFQLISKMPKGIMMHVVRLYKSIL